MYLLDNKLFYLQNIAYFNISDEIEKFTKQNKNKQ